MGIITLTSDLGNSSHYPAILKGIIYQMHPSATLVDVTHDLPSFDIMQGAYIVKRTFAAFPKGTIHLVAVDPDQHAQTRSIVMAYEGQYFIAPDNGLLSLVTDGIQRTGREIQHESLVQSAYPRSFRAAQVFAPTAAFLASGGPLEEVGEEVTLKDLHWGEPSYSNDCLRGKIIYIDKFGNAITNIQRANFMQLKAERRFEIYIRNVRLRRIVRTYSDVSKADALAIFGEGDYLEIAMREASAADLLGLKLHDMITIEFMGEN